VCLEIGEVVSLQILGILRLCHLRHFSIGGASPLGWPPVEMPQCALSERYACLHAFYAIKDGRRLQLLQFEKQGIPPRPLHLKMKFRPTPPVPHLLSYPKGLLCIVDYTTLYLSE